MTKRCPACQRLFRKKKPKQDETPLERHERIIAKANDRHWRRLAKAHAAQDRLQAVSGITQNKGAAETVPCQQKGTI